MSSNAHLLLNPKQTTKPKKQPRKFASPSFTPLHARRGSYLISTCVHTVTASGNEIGDSGPIPILIEA